MPISARYNIDGKFVGDAVSRLKYVARWRKWATKFGVGLLRGAAKGAGVLAGPVSEAVYHGYKAAKFGYNQLRWRANDMAMAKRSSKRGGKRKRTGWKKTLGKRSRVAPKVYPSKRRRFAPSTRRFGNRAGAEFNNAGKMTLGRRRRASIRQIAKQVPTLVLRYQAVRAMNNTDPTVTTCGKNALSHWENITGDGFYPLHVYDLMGVAQNTTIPTAYQLQITNAGFVNFITLNNGVQNNGVTASNTFQEEIRSGVNVSTAVLGTRYIAHEWYDIRFNLYGCRSQPTVFDIMYVSFTQDECDPLWSVTTPPTALGDHRASMYQALVQPMVYNPILPVQSGTLKGLKILKRKRVTIQASRNDEQDVNPSSVQFKMFIRDGRVCDYAHEAEKLADDNLVNDGAWVSRNNTLSDYRNHPRIRARRWLLVRALNTTNIDTAVQNSLNTPSYDIIIRRKSRYIEAA